MGSTDRPTSPTKTAGILEHFIQGGQPTAGGVMHAVTSYAQTISDADRAYEIEERGMDALAFAANCQPIYPGGAPARFAPSIHEEANVATGVRQTGENGGRTEPQELRRGPA